MKECPSCGNQVHEAASACPECGGRWTEDGSFAGIPAPTPAYTPVEQPRTLAELSPSQLRAAMFVAVFGGVVAGGLTLLVLLWMLGVVLGAGIE